MAVEKIHLAKKDDVALKAANLADLADVEAARANLDVHSIPDADAAFSRVINVNSYVAQHGATQAAFDAALADLLELPNGRRRVLEAPPGDFVFDGPWIVDQDHVTVRLDKATRITIDDDGTYPTFEMYPVPEVARKKAAIIVTGEDVYVGGGYINAEGMVHTDGTDGCAVLIHDTRDVLVDGMLVENVWPSSFPDPGGEADVVEGVTIPIRYNGILAILSDHITYQNCTVKRARYDGFASRLACTDVKAIGCRAYECFEGFQASYIYGSVEVSLFGDDAYNEGALYLGCTAVDCGRFDGSLTGAGFVSHSTNATISACHAINSVVGFSVRRGGDWTTVDEGCHAWWDDTDQPDLAGIGFDLAGIRGARIAGRASFMDHVVRIGSGTTEYQIDGVRGYRSNRLVRRIGSDNLTGTNSQIVNCRGDILWVGGIEISGLRDTVANNFLLGAGGLAAVGINPSVFDRTDTTGTIEGNTIHGFTTPIKTNTMGEGVKIGSNPGFVGAQTVDPLAAAAAALTAASEVVLAHTFSGSPGALTAGVSKAETGQVVEFTGAWEITAAGRLRETGAANNRYLAYDAGIGNGVAAATIRPGAAMSPGIIFRVTDVDNYLRVSAIPGSVALVKRSGGANTTLATQSVASIVAGQPVRLRVVVRNDQVQVFADGALAITHTLSGGDYTAFPTSLHKWGVRSHGDSVSTYDDLVVSR